MRYTLLTFLCAATIIAYLQRSALGVPSKQIEADLGLTAQDLGLVWLAWYAGYAAFQLPAGWVADRFGGKAALAGFAVAWSAMTAVAGLATGFTGLVVLWGLMGVAQAGIFVCATKAIGATFRKTEQAFASGALAFCMAGGAALSQYVTGRLIGPLTWRDILVVYAMPGVAWAVLFAGVVPRPEATPQGTALADSRTRLDPVAAGPPPPVGWSRLFTDPQMILLCAQQFLRAGAVALFFTWFPRYLQEAKGVDVAGSGSLAAWPLLAGMIGGLLGGTASDWLLHRTGNARLSRQGMAAVCTSACAVVSFAAVYAADAATAVLLVSVAAFGGYASGACAYATAIGMGGRRVAPVFATMNMAGNVGAGLFPFAVGRLVGGTGDWNLTLLLFGGMFAGSAACWVLLNPRGPLFEEDA